MPPLRVAVFRIVGRKGGRIDFPKSTEGAAVGGRDLENRCGLYGEGAAGGELLDPSSTRERLVPFG
jgi:hypothetical protein